jgi:NADH-quinone oxidoreductase subunit A
MIISYLPILILLAVAILFPVGFLAVTHLLGPKVRSSVKDDAYECGIPAIGSPQDGATVKFYRVAILFLLFDVEAALLFPWAVIFRPQLESWGWPYLSGTFGLFLLILMVGYVYAWKRGALEWD